MFASRCAPSNITRVALREILAATDGALIRPASPRHKTRERHTICYLPENNNCPERCFSASSRAKQGLLVLKNEWQGGVTATRGSRFDIARGDVGSREGQSTVTTRRCFIAIERSFDLGSSFRTQINELAAAVNQSNTYTLSRISTLQLQYGFTTDQAGATIERRFKQHRNLGTGITVNFQIEIGGSESPSRRRCISTHVFNRNSTHINGNHFILASTAVNRASVIVDTAGEVNLTATALNGRGHCCCGGCHERKGQNRERNFSHF